MDLGTVFAFLPLAFLHMVRAAAFVVVAPMFGRTGESRMLRVVLTVALGGMFWWLEVQRALASPAGLAGLAVQLDGGLLQLGLAAVREALMGFAAGLAVSLMTTALIIAGEIISNEMGFAMARAVNPVTGRNAPVMSQLLEIVALLLIFALDLHHDALRVLAVGYELVPVGGSFDAAPVFERLRTLIGETVGFALHYAIPVLGVMMLLTATFVMLARAVPNINLMEFSFGVRILLALLGSIYFLTESTPFLENVFLHVLNSAARLLEPL